MKWRRAAISFVLLLPIGQVGCQYDERGNDPASIARLGIVGLTNVKPQRVAPPAATSRPRRLVVKVALNTLYPTRSARYAQKYRRFHWVQISIAGRGAAARRVKGYNDDRSTKQEGSFQRTSAWVDQYRAVLDPAPGLPSAGTPKLFVRACDRDPRRVPGTFCQGRTLRLCLRRGVITGEPAQRDGVPRRGMANSCARPGFGGRGQSAAGDGHYFDSLPRS